MAGSAVLRFQSKTDCLRVVTLTVNNQCNLSCQHCYLQYDGPRDTITEDVLATLSVAKFDHLAIVGKEPFASIETTRVVERIIRRFSALGKTVSAITNGLGLYRLGEPDLERLAWIDVSLDGGPRTYAAYRGRPYADILRNLACLGKVGYENVNALHVVNRANHMSISDMIAVKQDFPFKNIVVSPYVKTRHGRQHETSEVSFDEFCKALGTCQAFMESDNSLILLSADAFLSLRLNPAQRYETLAQWGLDSKTVLLSHDPLRLGFIRVTYDGLVLTPSESLHTEEYLKIGRPLVGHSLNGIFRQLQLASAA